MTNKEAKKRYMRVFVPAMIGYILSICGASIVLGDGDSATPLAFTLALIPALFVFIFMWAQARWVQEIDEFMRMLQIKALMWGVMATTAATTAWGLFEFYTPVPKLPIFYVLPIFYGVYGIASGIIHKRYNASCKS